MYDLTVSDAPTDWLLKMELTAATYYAVIAQRMDLSDNLRRLRSVTSHAFTALLLIVSIGGFVQLARVMSMPASGLPAPTSGKTSSLTIERSAAAASTEPKQSQANTIAVAPSEPNQLRIPSINLTAPVASVGLNPDGSLGVPPGDTAGWYTGSPTPGEIGPAIIDGHVDSVDGIAVFWYLRDLKPGDIIEIDRADGSMIKFTVEKSATFDQSDFPTNDVYGNINYPGLRLITCEGDFDHSTGHYSHNLVVFARATP